MPIGDSITQGTVPGGYRLPLYNLLLGGGYTFEFVGSKTQSGDTCPDANHWGQGGWQISDVPATIDGRSYVSIQGENRSGLYDEMSDAISTTYFSTDTTTTRNIILLQIGINDILHQVVDSEYGSFDSDAGNDGQDEGQEWVAEGMVARLQALLRLIDTLAADRNLRIEVILGTLCQLTKEWRGDPVSDVLLGEVREYNSFIKSVIPAMVFSNISMKIVDHFSPTSGRLADGLHPNSAGYAAMALVWYNAITTTGSDVPYGPDKMRNSLDFWQAPGSGPRPLLVNIHGGGWITGDKNTYFDYKPWLDKGISCASINYRLTPGNPLPAPVHDAARAIQFLRSKATEWNIDAERIALYGSSAGACTAMWLLLHDDLADPDSTDPVLRQSSRVCAAYASAGQTSIDPAVISDWIPTTVPMHNMIPYAVGQPSMATVWPHADYESKYRAIYEEFSPIHHLDANDPPLYMEYNRSMKLPAKSDGHAIHHPMFGVKMWEKANSTAGGHESHLRFINSDMVEEYWKTTITGYASGEEFLLDKLHARRTAVPSAPSAGGVPAPSSRVAEGAFQLDAGDRIAFIGNALADRMQHHGWLEAMIHAKHPAHQIVVRNLAFAGDEIATRARSKDFGSPDDWLTHVQASVVFAFFGYNESFAGREGLAKFKEDLATLLRESRAKNYSGLAPPRIVLFSPIAAEKHPDSNYTFDPAINANLALYTHAMAEVARDNADVTFVDLFAPSQELFAEASRIGEALTINGVHLNEAGEGRLTQKVFSLLFGTEAPDMHTPEAQQLRAAVNAKNEMWHSRYRSVDGYNIYGDRSKIAYVSHPNLPKVTNAEIINEEMAQREVMTVNLERKVWALASGNPGPVEMLPLPVVPAFGTNMPGPNFDSTHPFIDGDEAIELMTLAPGLRANLFASEKQFPELANAVQMNWDTKGRLWVAVWPNYPGRTPTSKNGDKIIILEDTDRDGRADKCTTYLDNLNCPTGFQFFKDGILLVQAPDVWFVRDTTGDGKGDWKERVLMGLDSADSHHTANSLIYEPGGAILFSDGVFHRSQVETVTGVVRNIDGAIYRYEPLTSKFETYIAYGFANPHGRAFDYWGNDLITDATGNHTYFGPAFSGKLTYPGKHPRMKTIWNRPSRPSAGSTILTSTHFPDDYWGDYLNPNVIGFQGIFRVKLAYEGSGIKGERGPDLMQSKDPNFRPIDTSVGPDGALYVIDWHNPLIGHLQSHLRDSNRDKAHGRIYRITAENRPLAWQPRIDGEPIAVLLELLKRKENHIRNLAKIELGKHDARSVTAATKAWAAGLNRSLPDHAHHLLEALWVHQWHNVVDVDLLSQLLRSPNADARAAAVRVLCYWADRVPNALAELRRLASDEHPRVRLQAVRAASFIPTVEATEVALAATKLEVDYYLDYTIGETLRQLRPHWRKGLEEGLIARSDAADQRYLLRTLTAREVLELPRTPAVAENLLGRAGISDPVRAEALARLAQYRKTAPVALLIGVLESPEEIDVGGVGRLLLAQPPASLKAHRASLLKLGLNDTAEGRSHALAAVALADGSLDPVWNEATGSPLSWQSVLGAIHLIPNIELRATAYERVMPVLAALITELSGPDQIVAAAQRDAIRAAVSTQREPAAVFAALSKMIERGYQVTTAAQGLRMLPRNTWPADASAQAARALVAWAGQTRTSERTRRDYIETIQVADELVGTLPPAEAETLRKGIAGLRVSSFLIRAVVEEMRYDITRIVVPVGRPFEIIFDNPDVMPHNLVVVGPGARERISLAAMALPPEHLDRSDRAWVPESPELIAATKLLETGQSETLRIRALTEEGVYEYVCTFPGHWTVMYGQIIVTKDIEGYLQAHPVADAPKPAAAQHNH